MIIKYELESTYETENLIRFQINRAIEKFHLVSKRYMKEIGYTTTSNSISERFVKKMNKWFRSNPEHYNSIYVVWNKTYGLLQFKEYNGTS